MRHERVRQIRPGLATSREESREAMKTSNCMAWPARRLQIDNPAMLPTVASRDNRAQQQNVQGAFAVEEKRQEEDHGVRMNIWLTRSRTVWNEGKGRHRSPAVQPLSRSPSCLCHTVPWPGLPRVKPDIRAGPQPETAAPETSSQSPRSRTPSRKMMRLKGKRTNSATE